jgi:plastocyanin/predicted MPP superfamily phosphohydrolase
MADEIIHDHHHDGIDRRGFLKCIAWVGTGVLYTVGGGILRSQTIGQRGTSGADMGGFSFVQISDSHIGFSKDPNKDATATLRQAVERINALPQTPDFIIHTGDLSQLSKPSEFDTVDQVLKSAKAGKVFFVPGEHDVLTDNGRTYRERYGKDTKGDGWYSFNHRGVHFIGLVNVLNLKPGGFGFLGRDQLEWLKDDLANLSSSTPIVVFAHVPLWTVYPEWGWGTDDATQALGYLKRFGSVTVLNGHIHQVLRKVEGHVSFHTAMSTAFPQPSPGTAPSPGPMKDVAPDKLRSMLGLTKVSYIQTGTALAVIDSTLADASASSKGEGVAVKIDNFKFAPEELTVPIGANVTWTNKDDVPHTVTSVDNKFSSPTLDTDEKFSHTFAAAGTYKYYCKIHSHMTARVVAK